MSKNYWQKLNLCCLLKRSGNVCLFLAQSTASLGSSDKTLSNCYLSSFYKIDGALINEKLKGREKENCADRSLKVKW